ncbi:CsbD family protein [Saccharibacillus endophyticus]|uniref:Stress response protein CsbD n=1 Tax=Saccharibacillus endophyticus TaxID=2060666 RepID=A0ABQ2A5I0_9BACL|nr:CsbD family protein [Saccharibacillus endophyticus]GGH86493.1 stress response protein CsbD [Saccharibacillus endophyticus]
MADNGLGDKIKAGVNKAKGEIKDQVGNAKNDPGLQAEGKADKAKGAVQDKIGDVKNRDKH